MAATVQTRDSGIDDKQHQSVVDDSNQGLAHIDVMNQIRKELSGLISVR